MAGSTLWCPSTGAAAGIELVSDPMRTNGGSSNYILGALNRGAQKQASDLALDRLSEVDGADQQAQISRKSAPFAGRGLSER